MLPEVRNGKKDIGFVRSYRYAVLMKLLLNEYYNVMHRTVLNDG